MLAYILALTVGLGSFAVYMAAFFFPEIHRKNDFIWSGVGLFYAWVLWVCAGRITGGLLLGQVAGVALLGWSVTQTLSLRRQLTPRLQQTELPSAEKVKNTVQEKVTNSSITQRLSQLGKQVGGSATAAKTRLQQTFDTATQRQSQSEQVQIIDKRTPIQEQPASTPAVEQLTTYKEPPTESVPEVIPTNSPEPDEVVQASRESAAVEITLAETARLESSQREQEVIPEPIRPHPPDPELIEAALRDAEEKHQAASPPESDQPENPSPS